MRIGIIGGGHFWSNWNLEYTTLNIDTPYGKMSNSVYSGKFGIHEVFTLQRHGDNHDISPGDVPWCANIYGMGSLNLDFLIHVTACGGLNNNYTAGDIVLFDQLIDFTKSRPHTLGYPVIRKVTHLSSAEPISTELIELAHNILLQHDIKHKQYATMVTEEGPRFSTNAEHNIFRKLGGDLINQTSAPEVFLAQEVGLPILAISLVTNIVKEYETADDSETFATIPNLIGQFKNLIPQAISCIVQNIGNVTINRQKVNSFDTSMLDIKGNIDKS